MGNLNVATHSVCLALELRGKEPLLWQQSLGGPLTLSRALNHLHLPLKTGREKYVLYSKQRLPRDLK
ncbi:hypothetical protein E2C01_096907 [Portunus trituberculatus]|uniref:Uncharacterized protein n=1 Tax=Portunus trituberculatus TaxID=210409 RepID=A0A5B7K451_PORTR|nr:hypothetical protein [Portunus trituberculatus]